MITAPRLGSPMRWGIRNGFRIRQLVWFANPRWGALFASEQPRPET